MDGNQPVSPVTLQMLNSLIDTQTRLRDAAEARWASAREALFGLARLVAADWLEERQQQKGGLEVIRMEELSQVVYQHISVLSSTAGLPDVKQLQKAVARNDELDRKVSDLEAQVAQGEKLRQELKTAQQEIEHLQSENERLKAQNEKCKNRQATDEPGIKMDALPVPSWFQAWASSPGFDRQAFVIRLMGDSGLARRPEIIKALADQFGIDPTTGAVSNVFKRLKEMEFITIEDTAGTGKGAPPQVFAFDKLGEAAYIFLAQKLPTENEYYSARSAHSTDAHTLLVLKAANILATEGYEIVSKGEINIPLPDGRISSPDILARKNGQEIHVEVERDVSKGDGDARERKWQNAFDAGQGWIYVFCETENVQKKLVQEINRALASESRLARANTFMTNLEAIKAEKRHTDGSIWVSQKRTSSIR
jgi:hypothetical protein